MAALRRIMVEYKKLTVDDPFPDESVTVQAKNEDYFSWQSTLTGPSGTPYEDGLFFLDVDFPTDFPFKPPKVKFTTNVYHMNVSEKGEICMESLKDKWSPALSMKKILQEILDLLKTPNPDSPLRSEIAKLYTENKELHDKTAAEYTKKFAQ